jgi:hypothetical protein
MYLAKQKTKRWVCHLGGPVEGARTIQAARTAPLDIQKCPFIVLLEASSCPFPVNVMRVSVGDLV